jgi:uncharacterized protein (TIGR03118 family)
VNYLKSLCPLILAALATLATCTLSACTPADPATVSSPAASPSRATAPAKTPARLNAYRQVNLVSNLPVLKPQILDPLVKDAWGIAIRPPGAGGHFWINNTQTGTSTTYVGDTPERPLFQDDLLLVTVPNSRLYYPHPETTSQPTGIVYTGHSLTDFIVTGPGTSGEPITGASKFIFVGLDGAISGWTTGQKDSVITIDTSADGSMFTGLAVTEEKSGNRLYVCDFGLETFSVYDHQWNPVKVKGDFRIPGVERYYTPYNMQYLDGKLIVTLARQGDDPGEEDVYPGYGYVAEFDLEGNFLAAYEHGLFLNAPWGVAVAPDNFGAMSGTLLIGNFGDGRVLAYNRTTRRFVDFLRDERGQPIEIDGLWGILFGNGVHLGRTNHLYFAAGPNGEEDGLFGKLEPVTP